MDYVTKSRIYSVVTDIRKTYDLRLDRYPLDMLAFLSRFEDISLKTVNTGVKGFCGAAIIGDNIDTIILNSRRSLPEQQHDAAHEFFHVERHSKIRRAFTCIEKAKEEQDRYLEWQANEGAAELLIPYKLLIPEYCYIEKAYEEGRAWQFQPIQQLADKYGVTFMTMRNRISTLSYEIEQYKQGVPIMQLSILSKRRQEQLNIEVRDLGKYLERLSDFVGIRYPAKIAVFA